MDIRDRILAPVLETTAYPGVLGPWASILYVHAQQVQIVDPSTGVDQDLSELVRHQQERLGWVPMHDGPGWAAPDPNWSVRLGGQHLTVRYGDTVGWYDGTFYADQAWRAAAREHNRVLHITGPINSPDELSGAIQGGSRGCC